MSIPVYCRIFLITRTVFLYNFHYEVAAFRRNNAAQGTQIVENVRRFVGNYSASDAAQRIPTGK